MFFSELNTTRDLFKKTELSLTTTETAKSSYISRLAETEQACEIQVGEATSRVKALTVACKEAVHERKHWRHAAYSLAMLALQLCAGAVTIPTIETTEFMRVHRDLLVGDDNYSFN